MSLLLAGLVVMAVDLALQAYDRLAYENACLKAELAREQRHRRAQYEAEREIQRITRQTIEAMLDEALIGSNERTLG